jgi:hypothetical protein
VGPAWASAGVAGIVALLALILAFALTRKARPKPAKGDSKNLTAQLIELARERPLVAVGVVGAAAAVVIKNPRILGAVVAGLFVSRAAPPPNR